MGQWVVNSKVAVDLVCHLYPKFIFLCTDDNCSAWVSMFTWGELNCNTDSLILPDIFWSLTAWLYMCFWFKEKGKSCGRVYIIGTFREGYVCEFCKFLVSDGLFYMYLRETTTLCVNLMDSHQQHTCQVDRCSGDNTSWFISLPWQKHHLSLFCQSKYQVVSRILHSLILNRTEELKRPRKGRVRHTIQTAQIHCPCSC